MIGQITARAGQMDPVELELLRKNLRTQFGLDGSLIQQYFDFLWRGLLHFDFGPSLGSFPTPVNDIIGRNLPYTMVLSLSGTIVAWIFGNAIIPYFIVALVFQIVFAFVLGWFPLQSNIVTNQGFGAFISSYTRGSFLPFMGLLLVGMGWQIISMKSLASTTAEEDFVLFARYRGLSEKTIGISYVLRNSILTQITALAMSLGGAFSGSIMTEIIFTYPGVGQLIQGAILGSDYNMILGCITISIVAVSTATLIVDLIYPFIDPRIRYA